ncbi:MAG: DUF5808 domain-containing protein [Bacteroidales bacterium]
MKINCMQPDNQLDPMVDDYKNYKLNLFYFNRIDKRAIVPKRNRWMGWTVNFAHPYAWWWIAGLLALITFSFVMAL